MSAPKLYIYGAGGHAKVIADICLQTHAEQICGVIDDMKRDPGFELLGLPLCGTFDWLRQEHMERPVTVALAIGENQAREEAFQRCAAVGILTTTVRHPAATIAASATIGEGTVIMGGAVINPGSNVGKGAIINTGAVVEHDNNIGNFAHLSANATTGGTVTVGERSHLGLGALILPGLRIGADVVVGAGAVVVRDLPDKIIARGVPARSYPLTTAL